MNQPARSGAARDTSDEAGAGEQGALAPSSRISRVTATVGSLAAPRELTARALVMGMLIGSLLAVTNVYMGLKTGWWESGCVTATVVGFSALAATSRRRGAPYTALENNTTQTAAAAVGAMPAAAGLLGMLPALVMLDVSVSGWVVVGWGTALGVLGVLAAYLLRRRLVVEEALAFPTGITTAELITTLHAPRLADSEGARERQGRALPMALSAGVSVVITVLRDAVRWLPGATVVPGSVGGVSLASLGWGVAWMPMLLAVGMMVGLHTGLSMLAGAVLAWAVGAPALAGAGLVKGASYESASEWLMWPGVALLVGAAMVSLAMQARDFLGALRDVKSLGRREDSAPGWAVAAGLVACVLALALGPVFGLSTGQTLLALLLVVPLCAVAGRGAGQTDVSPVSQMGHLAQAVTGAATAGAVGANVAAGSVVAGAVAQTGVSLWALKAGHLLGASPRRQLAAQLVGALTGAAVGVPVYLLLVKAHGLGTEALPAPSARQFIAMAELMVRGLDGLPPHAGKAALGALALSLVLTLAARGRAARWLPSPGAMGIGMLLPASFSVSLCLGALLMAAARWRWPRGTERNGPAAAAGAIAGESLTGVLIAALIALGLMPQG